jgi:D-sedoheptulose 7-phosphate isomerase
MDSNALEAYLGECIAALRSIDLTTVAEATAVLLSVRRSGGTVYVAGNGGSAATAAHMATDLMLSSQLEDPPLRVVSLADSQSSLTATGNDVGFDQAFARQFSRLGRQGDLLLLVSASGNSPNILACAESAKAMGIAIIGFTGFDGGKLSKLADINIHAQTRVGAYGPVEDAHLAVNHMITEQLKSVARFESEHR